MPLSTTTKAWLHSLAAAGIGGGASAALSFLAMPDVFNASPLGLKHAAIATLIGMLVPVLTILKQSPLPTNSITTETNISQTTTTSKLPAWALIAILIGFTIPLSTGCSGTQVAQDIVNWTPSLVSAVTTADGLVAVVDPAVAPIVAAVTVGFDAASTLVVAQAKAYLANPSLTLLGTLQQAVVTFQQNVNVSILQAAKINDGVSQQKTLTALNLVGTIITTILGLIASIKGNTVSAPPTTVSLQMIKPEIDRQLAIRTIATHYGESTEEASIQYDGGLRLLQAHGF